MFLKLLMFPPCLRQSGPIKQELRFQTHRILIIHGPIETLDSLLIYIIYLIFNYLHNYTIISPVYLKSIKRNFCLDGSTSILTKWRPYKYTVIKVRRLLSFASFPAFLSLCPFYSSMPSDKVTYQKTCPQWPNFVLPK